MIDVQGLVNLAESLLPKLTPVVTGPYSVEMYVGDKLTNNLTENEFSQINDSVNEIFKKKHPDYEVEYWNRSGWNNLERRWHWCVWLTVKKNGKKVVE